MPVNPLEEYGRQIGVEPAPVYPLAAYAIQKMGLEQTMREKLNQFFAPENRTMRGQSSPVMANVLEKAARFLGNTAIDQVTAPLDPMASVTVGGKGTKLNKELSTVEKNLRNSGVEVRDYSIGHMIMPNGKGLSPSSSRGIANHWEVAIDAGYLPKSELTNLTHNPNDIVNGLLKKGWVRTTGRNGFETWDLTPMSEKVIKEYLDRELLYSDPAITHAYVDITGKGKGYNFTLQDYINNGKDLRETISNTRPDRGPIPNALELTLKKK